MKNTNRGIAPILIALIIAIILGGAYVLVKKKQQSNELPIQQQLNQQTSSTISDTSGWKTYRNEEYGFEFKYPPTWLPCDSSVQKGAESSLPLKPNPAPTITCVQGPESTGYVFGVPFVYVAHHDVLRDSLANLKAVRDYFESEVANSNALGVGGLSWIEDYQTKYISGVKKCFGDAGWTCTLLTFSKDTLFAIVFTDEGEKGQRTTDTIFSTFKFTK